MPGDRRDRRTGSGDSDSCCGIIVKLGNLTGRSIRRQSHGFPSAEFGQERGGGPPTGELEGSTTHPFTNPNRLAHGKRRLGDQEVRDVGVTLVRRRYFPFVVLGQQLEFDPIEVTGHHCQSG